MVGPGDSGSLLPSSEESNLLSSLSVSPGVLPGEYRTDSEVHFQLLLHDTSGKAQGGKQQ